MKTLIRSLPLNLLVLLLVYAAVSKLLAFGEFRGQLYNQTFPIWMGDILLYALPAAELTAAALMCLPGKQLSGLCLSLALMLSFTGYTGLVLLGAWSRVPCSCGGVLNHMSWRVHFFFNVFFLALNCIAIVTRIKETRSSAAGRYAL